ncbi:hypothetical protein V5O48_016539 [Marasmius crinis-equi]|uniref:Uncharacterized protein n=1 Tax=Marasmius crinis-equi TaxID=585013 RepID=A0ABR3ERF2_9AGAR
MNSRGLLTLQLDVNGWKGLVDWILACDKERFPPLCNLRRLSVVVDKHSSSFSHDDWDTLFLGLSVLRSLAVLDFRSFMCGFTLGFFGDGSGRAATLTFSGAGLMRELFAATIRNGLNVTSVTVVDAQVGLDELVSLWSADASSGDVKFLHFVGLVESTNLNEGDHSHMDTIAMGVRFPNLDYLHLSWCREEHNDVVYYFLDEHFDSLRGLKRLEVFVDSDEEKLDMDYWGRRLRLHDSMILEFRMQPGWKWVRRDRLSPWRKLAL